MIATLAKTGLLVLGLTMLAAPGDVEAHKQKNPGRRILRKGQRQDVGPRSPTPAGQSTAFGQAATRGADGTTGPAADASKQRQGQVRLRNGAIEPTELIVVTTIALRALLNDDPIGFYEVVQKARNPQHELFGSYGRKLAAQGLVDERGAMHESIRNVILSSAEGEGFGLSLVHPAAKD
jgi:hypothetical protein